MGVLAGAQQQNLERTTAGGKRVTSRFDPLAKEVVADEQEAREADMEGWRGTEEALRAWQKNQTERIAALKPVVALSKRYAGDAIAAVERMPENAPLQVQATGKVKEVAKATQRTARKTEQKKLGDLTAKQLRNEASFNQLRKEFREGVATQQRKAASDMTDQTAVVVSESAAKSKHALDTSLQLGFDMQVSVDSLGKAADLINHNKVTLASFP